MQQFDRPVSIFGVPTDVGAGRRGASMGPEGLRVAGLVEALLARGIDVVCGDVGGVHRTAHRRECGFAEKRGAVGG